MPAPGSGLRNATMPRGSAACLILIAAVVWLLWAAAGARAAGRELCDGWAACTAAGYDAHGYGAHQATSYWDMYAGNNCTNYTAYVEQQVYGVKAPGYPFGDGGYWADSARTHGIGVDHTPTVGAVAEWSVGTAGIGGPGHVGVVERVGYNGDRVAWIDVSQQDMSDDVDGYDWERIYHSGSTAWEPWPSHFIHFEGAPTRDRLQAMYGDQLYRLQTARR